MSKENDILNKLQIFATKHAKQLTDKPVTVYIAKQVPKKDLNKMTPHLANGEDDVAMRIVITTVTRDGIKDIYGFYIIVHKEFLNLYPTHKCTVENGILHELSHIPDLTHEIITGNATHHHGKQFKKTAKKLGVPRSHMKKRIDKQHDL